MQESQKPYSRRSPLIAQYILGQALNLPHSTVLSKTWVKGHTHCLKFLKEFHKVMNVDQIANIRWIMEKARAFQKNIYFFFIDYAKAFDCVDHNKLENSESDGNTRPPDLPLEKPVCRSGSNS